MFKVFSTKPLDEEDLSGLFQPLHSYQVNLVFSIKCWWQVVDWLAYPEYTLEDDLASFVLAPGLYYTSRLVLQWTFCCIILHHRKYWLLVCIKGKANNINILGLSGRPQPWRCRCWQPAMSPISSRSLLLWNLTWPKSWVKFNVGQFQNDWMGRRENNLREKEELWHVEVKDSN